MRKILAGAIIALSAICLCLPASGKQKGNLRLLYWNIQNGMWDGQTDNYQRFVDFVRSERPDICVWAEAQSNYHTNSAKHFKKGEGYLIEGWKELALRYGHKYVYIGGHRDNFPQAITSRFPIENVERITGSKPDSIVSHGAGWAKVRIKGQTINIVTLHTWPQKWGFNVPKELRERSRKMNEGDHYRRREIEYICRHTILTSAHAQEELWMMMGDFNAQSPLDMASYNYPENSTRYLTHSFILQNTPYRDIVFEKHRNEFQSTTYGHNRIDFVYLSPALEKMALSADVIRNGYTTPVRNAQKLSNFYHPSDHLPILVEFRIRKP